MTIIMQQVKSEKRRRRRGVILTSDGLERLKQAKSEAEYLDNRGNRYTLEALSERTELGVDTLMKVFACESGVDKQTLKMCFKAFNLDLQANDYYKPPLNPPSIPDNCLPIEIELPEGQVPLNSEFYIERDSIESDCYQAILKPGALIRLKAPRKRGKTSLMMRILNQAHKHGYYTVSLSLQLADKALLQDLDKFLQWFCANVSLGIKLPNRTVDYWDDLFGSKISCKIYFEEYILEQLKQPLVLGIDDVDLLFQYPELADDFFGLLRAWHEEGKNRGIWKKLRLIVVHSSEVHIPLNVNHSPFNVGLPIELPLLTLAQVEDLAGRYDLDLSSEETTQLINLVGGNPYLVRLGLYHIAREDLTLEELLTTSLQSPDHIYYHHLQWQLLNLQQQNPDLLEALKKVVLSDTKVELDLLQAFKLQSLGLVELQGDHVTSSCLLYQKYFEETL
ncbi:MAG TPA: serine/threonine protein kinase [Cyanothece sp. UBA12306]|nr:serine/threonine protein kinase [Cyanothece sp. UBA12306]